MQRRSTLLGRTLNRELPIGFSATTGSVTYAATVADATMSSETAAADLQTRLDEQDARIDNLSRTVDELTGAVGDLLARDGE